MVEPVPPEPPPCPTVDFAALEPEPAQPDARTLALSRVLGADEIRTKRGSGTPKTNAPRFHLDPVHVPRERPGPSHARAGGMGWMGLDRAWLDATIGPQVRDPFEAWLAARKELHADQRAVYLLFVRARYAR